MEKDAKLNSVKVKVDVKVESNLPSAGSKCPLCILFEIWDVVIMLVPKVYSPRKIEIIGKI